MVQLLARYFALEDPTGPIQAVGTITGNGDILVRTSPQAPGDIGIGRFDPSQSPPASVALVDGVELPFQSAAVSSFLDPMGRLVASPDGRAVAFEAGDLGQAGCGDPIVVPAANGLHRPFPGRAFELISDLAWAPDGSALYAIRRPTLDAPALHRRADGWCSQRGLWHGAVVGRPRGWCPARPTTGTGLLGWTSDSAVVLNGDGRTVSLDGQTASSWSAPCCHGTGFGGPLSPDGTTIAGVTLDNDFVHHSVTLLDVRDGSTRIIWNAPNELGCNAFSEGSTGRAGCLAGPHPTPGSPDAMSGYARVVAWAPDGSAVLLLDQNPDTAAATLKVVPVDGSGAGAKVAVEVPDLSGTLGFPNVGPAVVWLPATAPQ
jgi:hypothetical protein